MVLLYMMMLYEVIYDGSHSRSINMRMLPAKAMGRVYILLQLE
jgi:hypothetical protein